MNRILTRGGFWNIRTLMKIFPIRKRLVTQAFPTTLRGPARIWFNRLTPNSINTFKDLSAQFTSHFIGGHRYKKSTACLMSIRQREDETLRSYIARFNKENKVNIYLKKNKVNMNYQYLCLGSLFFIFYY